MLVQVGVMNVGDFVSMSAEDVSQALSIETSDAQTLLDTALKAIDEDSVKISTE